MQIWNQNNVESRITYEQRMMKYEGYLMYVLKFFEKKVTCMYYFSFEHTFLLDPNKPIHLFSV